MEIIQTTTISLTDEEKQAIHTLIEALNVCVSNGCYDCDACPLYVRNQCLGQLCEYVEER